MKVEVLIGFVSTIQGVKYRAQAGDVLEMPPGADWVKAGLVSPLPSPSPKVDELRKKKAAAHDG